MTAIKIIAPECKSFDRALDIFIVGAARQPTRLRSPEFPCGLPNLSAHGRRKVELGNQMFCDSIEMA